MRVLARKVCVLGDFAVGKTSLVTRAVRNTFSPAYLTTVGVRVESKTLPLDDDTTLRLVLWDIAGSSTLDQLRASYLRGANGLLLVADGTRGETFATTLRLRDQANALLGRDTPAVIVANKSDLAERWELTQADMRAVSPHTELFSTSAKTGDGVEAALTALGRLMAP